MFDDMLVVVVKSNQFLATKHNSAIEDSCRIFTFDVMLDVVVKSNQLISTEQHRSTEQS